MTSNPANSWLEPTLPGNSAKGSRWTSSIAGPAMTLPATGIGIPTTSRTARTHQSKEDILKCHLNASLQSTEAMLRQLKQEAYSKTSRQETDNRTPLVRSERPSRVSRDVCPSPHNFKRNKQRNSNCTLHHEVGAQLSQLQALTNTLSKGFGSTASTHSSDLDCCIEASRHTDEPLFRATANRFTVGKAFCLSSSMLELYFDRMEYDFHHVDRGKIHMVMYYQDLRNIRIARRSQSIEFRVGKILRHFGSEYEPDDPLHKLTMHISNGSDLQAVEKQLMGHVLKP